MKGVVFTEFLQLVEDEYGYETVDQVLTSVNPESGGAYTSVGTYDHDELIQLVVALSKKVDVDVATLVKAFGRYLYQRFSVRFENQLKRFTNAFEVLEQVEDYIHRDVRKLYPEAELPSFEYNRPTEDALEVIYQSSRPFADLCEGLIVECVAHFGEDVAIERVDLKPDGTSARFTLVRKTADYANPR